MQQQHPQQLAVAISSGSSTCARMLQIRCVPRAPLHGCSLLLGACMLFCCCQPDVELIRGKKSNGRIIQLSALSANKALGTALGCVHARQP